MAQVTKENIWQLFQNLTIIDRLSYHSSVDTVTFTTHVFR